MLEDLVFEREIYYIDESGYWSMLKNFIVNGVIKILDEFGLENIVNEFLVL